MTIQTKLLNYDCDGVRLEGYLAWDDSIETAPAILPPGFILWTPAVSVPPAGSISNWVLIFFFLANSFMYLTIR